MKILVSNFCDDPEISLLAQLFQKFGFITGVRLRFGPEDDTYAIVEMLDDIQAANAIRQLDGVMWRGEKLHIEKLKP
jgi:RNA recognition motif-containing protein